MEKGSPKRDVLNCTKTFLFCEYNKNGVFFLLMGTAKDKIDGGGTVTKEPKKKKPKKKTQTNKQTNKTNKQTNRKQKTKKSSEYISFVGTVQKKKQQKKHFLWVQFKNTCILWVKFKILGKT
jgi:anti-sigma28 factor (negative regulator of flagellin synthesis)